MIINLYVKFQNVKTLLIMIQTFDIVFTIVTSKEYVFNMINGKGD